MANSAVTSSRPNILFVYGEDWGRFASAYSGFSSACKLIATPHFDTVAAEGALFLNARTPAPGCNPARSAVFSGRHFFQTGLGAIEQGTVWDGVSYPTFPLLLESEGGYTLGYSYEGDFGKTNARIGDERTAFHAAGRHFGDFSRAVTAKVASEGCTVEEAKAPLLKEVRGNFQSFLASVGSSAGSVSATAAAAEATCTATEDVTSQPNGDARGQTSKPWLYIWGPTTTHRGSGWARGSGNALWGIDPEAFLNDGLPPYMPAAIEVAQDFTDYLGECCALDAGLGQLLGVLQESGQQENTLVIISGDHGPPGFPRAKATMYDLGCQVALAVRWPAGGIRGGLVVDDLISTMRLAPTVCQAGGVPVPDSMTAESLLPFLLGTSSTEIASRTSPGDDFTSFVVSGLERHVSIARPGCLPFPQRSIRTRQFLYICYPEPDRWPAGDPHGLDNPRLAVNGEALEALARDTMLAFADFDASPTKAWMVAHRADKSVAHSFRLAFCKRPPEELFDIGADPHCMNNIAESNKSVLVQLRQRLSEELTRLGDPRWIEHRPCCYDREPYSSIFNKYTTKTGQAYLQNLGQLRSTWQLHKAKL
eukprot:TRINITY_DN31095_c0_g1_i1.p1 TRINITY_DN31095_c0_g1~~TRINITY_DN31095_c0_g1_i1.p1  ORF type:complete len:593 (-),score=54.95 TRINITY_DN31095_c0_g1_i1:119-1897(-)